ncbi:hemerythrin-like metal-binding domain protein [Paucidesulfovibrio gracilis DSM 16080]|uniref:Hemerythrin-like metal-binding domain protein n=1 Tax=Paucidesulfovibrio gracilis DSM 16080 TaxID=1121449 RepID=A0A1T4W520_9BACT|nr:bacteriohemerythrin [Paucidesulfovibrio gracilis]SKA72239.1 hemerythrin-like metal-binding domain protein [Paucidesulfovibrio gracilis DSM 16080]
MKSIEWSPDLETGIGLLDAQHMNLVRLINDLGQAIEEGRGKTVIDDVMEQLKLYSSYHFTSEERLLRKHDYPELDEHHREHEEFVDEVEDFSLDLRTGEPDVCVNLHEYLRQWFVLHVQETDMRYAQFLRRKGEA